ncbi:MAG: sigma-70 family RNA polymerase sigma factor [Chitinophagaceae bacterium]|nr:sigma-70 family RNA polymerase sigma factor [Chitinophagaceae bacterium]
MVKEPTTDSALWRSFKEGDKEAFRQLYHQHFNNLYEYGCRLCMDTELVRDAIHDLFVKIWNSRPNLGDVAAVRSYLLVSLRGTIYNRLQREARIVPGADPDDHPFEMVFSVESEYIRRETISIQTRQLLDAMNQLSPRQKEVIWLRYMEELDYEEIAAIMGITVKSTYKLSARGLETLRDLMNIAPATLILLLTGAGKELFT